MAGLRLWRPCGTLCLLHLFAIGAAQDEELFQVHEMLESASSGGAGDMISGAADHEPVTSECVPEAAQVAWRTEFGEAVETMLQKTRRAMHQGLKSIADSFLRLFAACTCGNNPTLDAMKEQAMRLSVFATAKGVLNVGSKVSYEPMKALTVAGIDIHLEVNNLLVAWKLNKGAAEMGRALKAFMEEFKTEEEDTAPSPADEAPATHEHVAPDNNDPHGRTTPRFWRSALNKAFQQLGDSSEPITESCLSEGAAKDLSEGVENSFENMLEKTKRSMQAGLKKLGDAVLAILSAVEVSCSAVAPLAALRRFRKCAETLKTFASAKTLMNFGVHIEYEALATLKVGGIDIHMEINQLIGAWRLNNPPETIGTNLARFFQDFSVDEDKDDDSAKASEDSPPAPVPPEEAEQSVVIREAIMAADTHSTPEEVDASCFPEPVRIAFEAGVNAGIDHMLKKRKKTMQQGLREVADAMDGLMRSAKEQDNKCTASAGTQTLWKAAGKLQRLTRRTVVDYGTHIKYEAMKSLFVGGVAIHAELNAFIGAWSLGNRRDAGRPLGLLMRKCSEIVGHDEM